MEAPRLGVKLDLQLLAYTTGTAMRDPRCLFDLHHSAGQCWILNPQSRARDRTHILTDTSWIPNPLNHNRNFYLESVRVCAHTRMCVCACVCVCVCYKGSPLSVSVPVSLSYLETQMANEVKKRLSTILGIGKMPIKMRKTLSDA